MRRGKDADLSAQGSETGPAAGWAADGDARRVLILSAAMGGGHMQVARELQRRLTARGHEARVSDLLELMPAPTGAWLGELYPWLVNRGPWLYDLIYRHFFLARQRQGGRAGLPVRLALPGLRRVLDDYRPHAVVSTYHLAGGAAARMRARHELSVPALTFITTFGVHELWLHPHTDAYLCISDDAVQQVSHRTGSPARLCEPVVRPQFTAPLALPDRGRWGLAPDRKVALLVAGALGMGRVDEAVRALRTSETWQAAVVCGRNDALRRQLDEAGAGVVLGWVDDMASLMAAADVVVDNAAGSTAKEALALGVPVVTFRPIAGHGRDDAQAMARLGLTDVVDDEAGLLDALDRAAGPLRAERALRGQALFGTDPVDEIERWAHRPPDDGQRRGAPGHGGQAAPAAFEEEMRR